MDCSAQLAPVLAHLQRLAESEGTAGTAATATQAQAAHGTAGTAGTVGTQVPQKRSKIRQAILDAAVESLNKAQASIDEARHMLSHMF